MDIPSQRHFVITITIYSLFFNIFPNRYFIKTPSLSAPMRPRFFVGDVNFRQNFIGASPMTQFLIGASPMTKFLIGAPPMTKFLIGASPVTIFLIGASPLTLFFNGASPYLQGLKLV